MTERATPEQVTRELDGVRRRLLVHGGDLRVAEVTSDGDARIEFVGACSGCPALAFTFSAVVAPAVEEVPGVRRATSTQVRVSKYVMARVRALGAPCGDAR